LQLTTLSADIPKPQSTFQEILKLDIAFLESECEQRLTYSATLPTHGFTQGMDPDQEAREVEIILLDESMVHQWKSANDLLDSQQFDPAIAGFTSLLDTSYDAKAREKIQVATNLAAVAQRKQAASLFIKAVKARSSGNKTVMLLESKQLLQEVLRKYPQADIIDKVAQNLTTIEQHIAQLNPTLLEE
jgi:outer membrane protein assembly factor BamD (BamD/ComL family)